MKLSLRAFFTIYTIVISWVILVCLLRSNAIVSAYLFGIPLLLVLGASCHFGVKRIRFFHPPKADHDEIRREDDVLLQGTAFASAILFFYVNTLIETDIYKIVFSFFILSLTLSFFSVRAYGKIKDSPEYRAISMALLAWVIGAYVYTICVLLFPSLLPALTELPLQISATIIALLAIIPMLPTSIASSYFSNRYGFNPKENKKTEPKQEIDPKIASMINDLSKEP